MAARLRASGLGKKALKGSHPDGNCAATMNTSVDAPGSTSTENIESHPAGYIASSDFAFAYRAAGGKNFLRKFDLYETGNHFYIVGRDPRRNRVRLLTIERNPDEVREHQDVTLIKLSNDLSQYNGCKGVVIGGKPAQREWHVDFQPHNVADTRLHLWFKEANLSVNATMFKSEEIQPEKLELILENYRDVNSKLSFWKRHDGFSGLVGFAKFTDCKYLVGVIKKDVVARICGSEVFSVSSSIFLPFRNGSGEPSVTEQRYRSLFKSIDITRGFYFSYDYDLSRSLQSNMGGKPQPQRSQSSSADHGISQTFDKKFVWNFHLLRDVPAEHHCWAVYLMHGYVEQHRLSIGFNRVISLALLARRSCHFAGTRYRKRGLSMLGHCANEVETEQIIIDESQGSSSGGHFFTSFVQLRASIPLFWSQPTELNFKPDVVLHFFDPLFHVTSIHFCHLLKRYGSPIHVFNLIKGSGESKPRESLLNYEFEKAIQLLNAGICEPQHAIGYTHFDFHSKHKRDSVGVFDELRKETEAVVNRTGIFHSGTNRWASSHPQDAPVAMCMQQQGVLRSNCIDCLDRTNVAQFYAGVKAMSLQLQALGISNTPVPMESDLPRLLMDLYSRMGNELALQYVGSVAHDKMGGTGKTTSFGLRTLSKLVVSAQRYISNTFTDIEKQQAIDVFLGTFIPRPDPWTPIWAADDLSFCWNDKTNPQYAQLRRNRPPDNWWRKPIAMFHSGYCMGLNTADESLVAPEFLRGSASQDERRRLKLLSDAGGDVSLNCSDAGVTDSDQRDSNAHSHKCTRTFRMMLMGIDANFDRTHAKGKYITFEPLLDQKDPAQEKRFSTVDDGDDNATLIFADEFSMLNRECGKPQRLQAFPTTDSSVLSLMANLFTQRSLDRNEPPLCSDLFLKSSARDWRLETTISSAAQHGVLKQPTYNDTRSISEHANACLKQHVMSPHHAFHMIDVGLLHPTPRRDFSDAMAELFSPEDAGVLEGTRPLRLLGRDGASVSQLNSSIKCSSGHNSICFVDDDESSTEVKSMKAFISCSQDWEQLHFLHSAAVGITIELRDNGFGSRRAVIISYRAEAVPSSSDIRIGDEIDRIMVMGKNFEYDGLDLIELLSEEFEPAYDRIIRTLHGCSGTQVVVSLVRVGLPVGHFCLIRDGSFEDSTETALHFDGDRSVAVQKDLPFCS